MPLHIYSYMLIYMNVCELDLCRASRQEFFHGQGCGAA